MIDIEFDVYDYVVRDIDSYSQRSGFSVECSSEYVNMPKHLPFVTITEIDNRVVNTYGKSINPLREKAVRVAYEVTIYTNLSGRKRSQAKEIAKVVDGSFVQIGFTRTMSGAVENWSDTTIYRMKMRYQATVIENDDLKYYIHTN